MLALRLPTLSYIVVVAANSFLADVQYNPHSLILLNENL